jgi:hypothetical protein
MRPDDETGNIHPGKPIQVPNYARVFPGYHPIQFPIDTFAFGVCYRPAAVRVPPDHPSATPRHDNLFDFATVEREQPQSQSPPVCHAFCF